MRPFSPEADEQTGERWDHERVFNAPHGAPQGVRTSPPPYGQARRSAQEPDPGEPAEERNQEVHGGIGVRVRVDDDRTAGNSDPFFPIELSDRSGKSIRHQRCRLGYDREGGSLSPYEVWERLQEVDDRLLGTPARRC